MKTHFQGEKKKKKVFFPTLYVLCYLTPLISSLLFLWCSLSSPLPTPHDKPVEVIPGVLLKTQPLPSPEFLLPPAARPSRQGCFRTQEAGKAPVAPVSKGFITGFPKIKTEEWQKHRDKVNKNIGNTQCSQLTQTDEAPQFIAQSIELASLTEK